MIRKAIASDFPSFANDECLIRILALNKAYGCDVPFIQYFTDEQGAFLSVMDGAAVLYAKALTEEWFVFLHMNPDIRALHCPLSIGEQLLSTERWQGREGVVMHYEGPAVESEDLVCTSPNLPKVYELLNAHFPGISPFNYWYPDVSHRIRHNCSHIACLLDGDRVVSTAMTVAETDGEAIIGQVATAAEYRRRGMAKTCVKSVVAQCKGKMLYILPINENAEILYQSLGFVPCGAWCELQRN